MKKESISNIHEILVERVTGLPHKILLYHEVNSLPHIVLNYLGHKDCFNLKQAAYFIDNPDFDQIIGIAGFSQDESKIKSLDGVWEDPHSYSKKNKDLKFDKNVRSYSSPSFQRQKIDLTKSSCVCELGKKIGFKNPQYFAWNVKHGNHGLLIYECKKDLPEKSKNLLRDAASFLGFCAF